MISRPEYTANSNKLDKIAQSSKQKLSEDLANIETLQKAHDVARDSAAKYYKEFQEHLQSSLREAGLTVAKSYANLLNLSVPTSELVPLVEEEIKKLYRQKYHRFTLTQRLRANYIIFLSNIKKSSVVGKKLETRKLNLSRIFVDKAPFGAQVSVDRRVLLTETVRLEHNIAKKLAEVSDIDLVRWTLSDFHSEKDICDHLADSTQKEVVQFISTRNLSIDPKGVYFVRECPQPPHPNCQCTLSFIYRDKVQKAVVKRTIESLVALIDRILRRNPRK